jgi:hypothetical protein
MMVTRPNDKPNDKHAAFFRELNLWGLSITQDNELGKEAIKVLFALYKLMHKDKGYAWIGHDRLGFETGMRRQNVQRGIKQAADRRHVKVVAQGTVYGDQTSNHYFMSFPEGDSGEAVEARLKKYNYEHDRRRTMINGHAPSEQPQPQQRRSGVPRELELPGDELPEDELPWPPQQQRSVGRDVTSRELPEDELPFD